MNVSKGRTEAGLRLALRAKPNANKWAAPKKRLLKFPLSHSEHKAKAKATKTVWL